MTLGLKLALRHRSGTSWLGRWVPQPAVRLAALSRDAVLARPVGLYRDRPLLWLL